MTKSTTTEAAMLPVPANRSAAGGRRTGRGGRMRSASARWPVTLLGASPRADYGNGSADEFDFDDALAETDMHSNLDLLDAEFDSCRISMTAITDLGTRWAPRHLDDGDFEEMGRFEP